MKLLSEMSEKEFENHLKTITPHLPIWRKDGAVFSHYSSVDFVDKVGNKAIVTSAHWKDKKGKSHETVAWLDWRK